MYIYNILSTCRRYFLSFVSVALHCVTYQGVSHAVGPRSAVHLFC